MLSKKADRLVISLDFGSDSIKMIKGMKSEDKICVSDFACQRYPAGEREPDLISRHIHKLLTSVVDARKIKKARIHSTISGRKLCIRIVKLPVMPEAELYQALRSKIRKYVSPDLAQVIFSFSVLGETQERDIKKLDVVFMAIQKTFFDEYLQFFKLTGVEPKVITSPCFSGWNLIRELGLNQGVDSLMLINIDNQETDLTVYREDRFVFTRNISIGGKNFTDKLRGQAQFSLEREEDVKLLWGLAEEGRALEATEEAHLLKIRELLQGEADVLCKEIELTAHHYYQITHGKRIDKCLVLGEGSQIGGLIDFLKQSLEISVEGLHIPDAKLELTMDRREEFERNLPLYTHALGAILIGPDDINLLAQIRPQAKKVTFPIKFFALPKTTAPKMAAVAVIVFICLGLLIFTFLKGINLHYQGQIRSYKERRDRLQDRAMQLMQVKRKMDILDFEKKLYLRLIKEYPAYTVIIAEICKAIPSERIVLDELKFYSNQAIKFNIAGKVLGIEATESEVTNFVLALERSGYFENISVTIRGGPWRQAPEVGVEKLSFAIDGVIKLKD